MRTIERVTPDSRIRVGMKIFELIPGGTPAFMVSLKEVMEIEFIKVVLRAHKKLSIEKKKSLHFQPYFYKEVGRIINQKEVFYEDATA